MQVSKPHQMAAKGAQQRISKASRFQLRVAPSSIHRLGVFADQQIPGRVTVIEYTGERISYPEARRRFRRIAKEHGGRFNYLARLNSRWVIDGAIGGNGSELINHSCAPNVKGRRARGRLWFVSLRRIQKGEELLVDYRFPKKAPRVPCHCGSTICRGTINRR